MVQKTEAQKRIKSLIDRFTENISQYKRTDYDEANTRTRGEMMRLIEGYIF